METIREQIYFVGLYSDGGYVGIDPDSGGYPYNAGDNLWGAKLWLDTEKDKERMVDYFRMFPKLSAGKIKVTVTKE
jgi:hypothetical protein